MTLSKVQPVVGIPVKATLTDPDGGISKLTWQWSTNGGANVIDRRQLGHLHAGCRRRGQYPDGDGELLRRR